MGTDHCTFANFYIGPDYRPRANDNVVSQLGTGSMIARGSIKLIVCVPHR